MSKNESTAIGQQIRHAVANQFVFCGDRAWSLASGNPVALSPGGAARLLNALVRFAATALTVSPPHLGETDRRQVLSAAGFLCVTSANAAGTPLCPSCREKAAMNGVLGGKTLAEAGIA